MSWFLESTWPSVMIGLAIEAALGFALWTTGRRWLVIAMGAVPAATLGMVVLERVVVTPREEVADALNGIAAALVANDVDAVLEGISPQCARRNEVRSRMSRVTIRGVRIGGDLEVRTNQLTLPPSATAFFTGHIEAKDSRGEIPYEHMIRKFKVTLHREQGKWRVFDFSDTDPRETKKR